VLPLPWFIYLSNCITYFERKSRTKSALEKHFPFIPTGLFAREGTYETVERPASTSPAGRMRLKQHDQITLLSFQSPSHILKIVSRWERMKPRPWLKLLEHTKRGYVGGEDSILVAYPSGASPPLARILYVSTEKRIGHAKLWTTGPLELTGLMAQLLKRKGLVPGPKWSMLTEKGYEKSLSEEELFYIAGLPWFPPWFRSSREAISLVEKRLAEAPEETDPLAEKD
jgi:hypothetical protein